MPLFSYRARDAAGRFLNGTFEAPSLAASADQLRSRGLLVLELGADSGLRGSAFTMPDFGPIFRRRPRAFDVETSFRQLALMDRAGLPILQALRTAATNARRRSMGRVLEDIGSRIEAGSTLTDAMHGHDDVFPPVVLEIVHAGEHSGALDKALERSADHLQRRRELRATFLQALFYPTIVLVMAVSVAAYMVIVVVPILQEFIGSSRKKLPWITQELVDTSMFVRGHGLTIVVVILTLIAALLTLDRYPPTRAVIDRTLYRIPLLGKLRMLATTASFSRSLAVLLSNGIALVKALSLCEGILGRPEGATAIAKARRRIIAGDKLADGLAGSRAFAPILPKMIDVGEASGTLQYVLEQVADYHEAELRTWIKRASVIIEPIITVVVGVLVGFVYVAFFLALFAAAGAV